LAPTPEQRNAVLKIAVVGTGISRLIAAYLLQRHEVTVFEADGRSGGHTATVDIEWRGAHYAVDTGFIVCNDRTYPLFSRLLRELGVAGQPTAMGFSVAYCEGDSAGAADTAGQTPLPRDAGLRWRAAGAHRRCECRAT
jgi:predicted NAD/FAD-binding protein